MRKGEQTRERVLDTALELFWKRSFHAVNTAEICEAAGVNKATLYRYFPSKIVLAVNAVHRGRDRTLAYVFEGAFEESKNPRERLRGIFERVHRTHCGVRDADEPCPGCPFVNLGVELGTQSAEMLEAVNTAFAEFSAYYRQIVVGLNGSRKRRPLDVEPTVEALLQVMNAGMVAAKLRNDPDEILRARGIAEGILAV